LALGVFFHPALRIRFLPSFARHPIIGGAQFLTHGRQFGEKNEESGDDGTIPQFAIRNPHSAIEGPRHQHLASKIPIPKSLFL
jgi:hypothetical protein